MTTIPKTDKKRIVIVGCLDEGRDNKRNACHSANELNGKQKVDPESSEESTHLFFSSPCLLSEFEDQLSESWAKCLSGDERAFHATAAFRRSWIFT